MSVQIANLTAGVPVADTSVNASPDANRIPVTSSGTVYTLYGAPVAIGSVAAKAAIVKGIRITNTFSSPVKLNLFMTYFLNMSGMLYRVRRQIAPVDMILPVGFVYIDDGEITLPSGASIQAGAKPESGTPPANSFVDFVISGVERDVT